MKKEQEYNAILKNMAYFPEGASPEEIRLEGNTYSLLETERLLKLSEIVEGKDLKETQMILNHKEAIEFLVDSASDIGICL